MQREVRQVTVKDAILDYVTRLTMASRGREEVEVGVSPRGALFLIRAAKARAYMEGRDYVTGTDVQAVFADVCAHRVLVREESGRTAEAVLQDLIKTVETPDHRCFPGLKK